MNKRTWLWLLLASVVVLLSAPRAATRLMAQQGASQQEVAIPLNMPATITSDINIGATGVQIPFDVSASTGFRLDVVVPIEGAQFSLRNPAGAIVVAPGDPRLQFIAGRDVRPANPLPGGIFALEEISTPVTGTWTITLNFPASPYKTVVVATILLRTSFQVGIAIERESFVVGEDVSIGLLALNNGLPITGLTPTITVTPKNPSGTPISLPALDNGANPDGLAGDGVYSIDYTFQAPGTYLITGTATIPTPNGGIMRTATHTVTVKSQSLTVQNITTNNSTGTGGCVASVNVAFALTAAQAGDFIFSAVLRASNGNELSAQKRTTVAVGAGSVTLPFSSADIKTVLGVDGPYTLSSADVFQLDSAGSFSLVYKGRDVLTTPSLPLSGFCSDPIELRQSLNVTPILRDGFIESLRLTFPIKVANAGVFSISFKIVDKQGQDIGLFAENRSLSVGMNDVSFTIPGQNFLGNDGPYQVISLIVLGPGGSAQLARLGDTGPLQRWQFLSPRIGDLNNDGFVDILDHAILSAALNQPALVPGDRRDLNRDGVIDIRDLELLVRLCTRAPCEPSSPVGPGIPYSSGSTISSQKSGSVLIYNVYTSSVDTNRQNTRINLTNTHPSQRAYVHLFFVDGSTCSIADSTICLTPNQTTSFLASDIDPGTTGYIVAVAVDSSGCPINFNYLIGDEYVKFSSGHAANLGAEAIAAIPGGLPACNSTTSTTAVLAFDGVSYNLVPRVLALDNIGSRGDGNDTLLIVNRIGGNLATGAATLTGMFGIFYDDAEAAVSFGFNPGTCQFRSSISNNFPRITPRFETFIPPGRTGWIRMYSQNDQGILGSAINFNAGSAVSSGAFNQGHNLHKLTFTSAMVYTIPIFPPSC